MNGENGGSREFGKCRLDVEKRVLWRENKPVGLPLKAVELLCLLVERSGEVVTKDEIWQSVWQDTFVEETNLTHNIYLLRKTLRDLGEENLIQTVPRRGYRFTGEVRDARNSEIIIEKRTQTQTLIEIQEEISTLPLPTGKSNRFRKKKFFAETAAATVLILGVISVIAFFAYQNRQAKSSDLKIKSIAVLPFKTIDSSKENEFQGLGLADVLITRLSNIKAIDVRPLSAVSGFESGKQDSVEIGKKLSVDAILEGTIYKTADKVRITARFVKVSDGAMLWTGQFERLLQDELRIQNELSLQLIDALALKLSGGERNAVFRNYTENPDAYEFYLKGRFEWNKRTWNGMLDAERLFRNAIEKDPNFALAYVGLADTTAMNTSRSRETFDAAQKALELEPNLAEAHATLGFLKTFHKWEWREAEAAFKRSIELNPNYATAHHWYAQLLTVQGRHEEAKTEMRRALEINPLSYNFLADLGQIYFFNREYKEAEAYCLKALEIYPDFGFAHEYLYYIYLKTGEYDKAVEEFLKTNKISVTFANESAEQKKELETQLNGQQKIYREGGIKKFMENQVEETLDPNACSVYAVRYAFIGEKQKALACLETAYEGRGFLSIFIKANPIFDDLRSEPRYREILRKMNLEN